MYFVKQFVSIQKNYVLRIHFNHKNGFWRDSFFYRYFSGIIPAKIADFHAKKESESNIFQYIPKRITFLPKPSQTNDLRFS